METKQPLYQLLAGITGARLNCIANENQDQNRMEWTDRHTDRIESLVKDYLPSGSGIDSGVTFNFDKSTADKLVLDSSYHCMDDMGGYDGWIDFTVIITPSLQFGFQMDITGDFSRHDLEDYLHEVFSHCLNEIAYEVA